MISRLTACTASHRIDRSDPVSRLSSRHRGKIEYETLRINNHRLSIIYQDSLDQSNNRFFLISPCFDHSRILSGLMINLLSHVRLGFTYA
ncbi:hypothetical protein PPACK8108_LOCUS8146 [Phakopsora pachyrhizi]|uniref:Uncharacterized protein n=1 Tax=Phakopsora pachyrhizi TaxID=170000 RepID=A0AAV0AUQ8_PHAPC|nr:hypothetical protein PPACK8108_LOCUS8146 [Phakopsora pachyrhizi]